MARFPADRDQEDRRSERRFRPIWLLPDAVSKPSGWRLQNPPRQGLSGRARSAPSLPNRAVYLIKSGACGAAGALRRRALRLGRPPGTGAPHWSTIADPAWLIRQPQRGLHGSVVGRRPQEAPRVAGLKGLSKIVAGAAGLSSRGSRRRSASVKSSSPYPYTMRVPGSRPRRCSRDIVTSDRSGTSRQ